MAKLFLKRSGQPDIDLFSEPTSDQQIPEGGTAGYGTEFLSELNPIQREAVTASEGPLLIVAGAGSGKTRVLTYRVAFLLAKGVKPWNILALTFTNKAAAEMKERISRLVGDERARPLWMGTFHSVFSRVLRREAEHLGYTASFTIYDTDDSLGVVRSAMTQFGISTQDFSPKAIHNRISAAKNAMISPALYKSQASDMMEGKIALVYEQYEQRLRSSNAMDFDDLLVKTIELYERHPDILRKYQELYEFILIDEYQDTNRAQYVVVKMLAALNRNICVVGDDAQSIYRFRGADIQNILDFERDYPDYRVYRLEQNYRSTKTILAAADDVIKNNRKQIAKTLWTDNIEGEKIYVQTLRDEREEGEEVLRTVQRQVREGKSLNDIAILYRTNSQSLSIEDALRRANVPYGIVGGVAFYRRKEIKDALSYFRLLVNTHDDESFSRAVNMPARGIGEVTMKRLRHFATTQKKSLLEAARHPETIPEMTPRVGNMLRGFAEMIDLYRNHLPDMSPAELARLMLSESGLLQSYKDEGTPEAVARWDNVQRILSHIAEFSDANPGSTLDQYLQEIALLSDTDSYDAQAERVVLMTIHSAKGLEFSTVIVVGMEEGLFPVGNSMQEQDELEEERRLFYVAVTRAKQMLYLFNCERRYRFGELSYPTPSRFLNEIRTELLELSGTTPSRLGGGMGGSQRVATHLAHIEPPAPVEEYEAAHDDYSQVEKPLTIGSQVVHPTFGRGRVEGVIGNGDKLKITVRFETVGRKQLMMKFANLRVL